MNVISIIKAKKILIIVSLIYIILIIFMPDKAVQSGKNSMYYIIEMFEILPVVFILTSLIETWVPKEVIINGFGEKSGIKGIILSFLLGSFSAGPIYAAFPVCKMLLKKGASIVNIIIILSAWAVIKVPMLVNEVKFLGLKFMGIRWILTIISILIMANVIAHFIKKDDINIENDLIKLDNKDTLKINEQYCIGCGLCAKLLPQNFIINGKARIINNKIEAEAVEDVIETIKKCPAKAIYF
jgi:uncharacterized membrane protein YraQ (UPF0718 family)